MGKEQTAQADSHGKMQNQIKSHVQTSLKTHLFKYIKKIKLKINIKINFLIQLNFPMKTSLKFVKRGSNYILTQTSTHLKRLLAQTNIM